MTDQTIEFGRQETKKKKPPIERRYTEPKPTHGSLEWLKARQRNQYGETRFGASEAPTLMGVNEYQNLVDLFINKHESEPTQINNPATHRGNVLEPALIAEASRILEMDLIVPDVMFCYQRLMANLDGANHNEHPNMIVEAKTTTRHSLSDEIPMPYYWQAMAQMATTTAMGVMVICLDRRQEIGTWDVQRDEHAIELLIEQSNTIGAMFDRHEIPAGANHQQITQLFPNPEGIIELDDDQMVDFQDWISHKQLLETAQENEKLMRDIVANIIGNKEIANHNGKTIATFKSRKVAGRFDNKRFAIDHPHLVDEYTTKDSTTRVLRLSTKKETK